MLAQFEQQALFNAVNFSRNIYTRPNNTIFATGLATIWCPSNASVLTPSSTGVDSDYTPPRVSFTSYVGCTGTWFPEILQHYDNQSALKQQINGAFNYDTSYTLP